MELPRPTCRFPKSEIVKPGKDVTTVTLSGRDQICLPYVPVIVALYCPRLAVLDAVSVTVLDELVEAGEQDAVTPLGRPETERLTLSLNPFCH